MCVDTKGYAWERPAMASDLSYFEKAFPGIDFRAFLEAMSRDCAKPLCVDMALIGAMLSTPPDDLGMCFVPFCGIEGMQRVVVKLPVMTQIVDWCENSALGTDMWEHASEISEEQHRGRFHFAMQCGCGFVARTAVQSGAWQAWQQRFNRSRADIYGRSRIVRRETNSIEGLDITPAQLQTWRRMREVLCALPAVQIKESRAAA